MSVSWQETDKKTMKKHINNSLFSEVQKFGSIDNTTGCFLYFAIPSVRNRSTNCDKGEILNFVFTTGGVDDIEPLK